MYVHIRLLGLQSYIIGICIYVCTFVCVYVYRHLYTYYASSLSSVELTHVRHHDQDDNEGSGPGMCSFRISWRLEFATNITVLRLQHLLLEELLNIRPRGTQHDVWSYYTPITYLAQVIPAGRHAEGSCDT